MNFILSNVYSFLDGWIYARELVVLKAQDDASRQGHSHSLAMIQQIFQVYVLSKQVSRLEQVSGHVYFSWQWALLTYASIPFIGWAATSGQFASWKGKCVRGIYNHIGSLCQVASAVTAIALFRLGHRVYAVTSLTVLGLGYLERNYRLFLKVRRITSVIACGISLIGVTLRGERWIRVLTALEIGGGVSHLFASKNRISYEQVAHSSHLTYAQFENIWSGRTTKFEVNREHVNIEAFPVVRELNFEPILTLGDTFDWQEEAIFSQLEKELEADARWKSSADYEQLKTLSLEGQKTLKITYVKNHLYHLVNSIKNECIKTGEVLDYGILKNYLGYIAQELPSASKDLQTQALLELAIGGGDYCGPGVYAQLEVIATALLMNHSLTRSEGEERARLPLKRRLLLILQQERLKVVMAFHLVISKLNPFVSLSLDGEEKVHSFNRTVNLLAYDDFGLPDQGARHDGAAVIDFFEKKLMTHLIGIYPEDLWKTGDIPCLEIDEKGNRKLGKKYMQGYDAERITKSIQEQIGIPLIPKAEIYAWANNWIGHVEATEKQKKKFIDFLIAGKFETKNLKFQTIFVQAMLVDMGILSPN